MALMAAERVLMKHPKVKGEPVSVTRKAFDGAWAKQGWELFDPDKASKDELVKVAGKVGVDTSGTKDDIAARLTKQES